MVVLAMSYFSKNFDKIKLTQKSVPTDKGLRECQIGAYWAVNAHFTSSDEPALVVMPTGSGKTALLLLLSFAFKAKRVLVINPSAVLRDQLKDNFCELTDLVAQGILQGDVEKPKVKCQNVVIRSKDQWAKLEEFDVIVSTPHTISPKYHKMAVPPPEGLFDVVFFDEAHHIRAPSWEGLLKMFGSSKKVLLTATPFRLDQLKMLGRMIYNYPIERAIDNRIYQKIEYHKVKVANPDNRNQVLCDTVKAIVEKDKENGLKPKILVRTDKVKKSDPLIALYAKNGLKIGKVDYTQSMKANKSVLTDLRDDKIDGIVCVGMLGEGIDIPALKIAVFHDPPKSFPLTIQFVGRICRPTEAEKAHVIADPEQIMTGDTSDELRRLYGYDKKGWRDLIPEMVDEVIGRETEILSLPYQIGSGPVNYQDIKPFYSVQLYALQQAQLNLDALINFPENVAVFKLPTANANLRAFITQRITSPAWVSNLSEIRELTFDLHLYYYHPSASILFESTTFDPIAEEIRNSLTNGNERKLFADELAKALHSETPLIYNMLGLASAIGSSPSIPTYKTLMGKEVQASIVPTDSRVFVPGHALARKASGETIGFSSFQGKIWSLKRGTIAEFLLWCDAVAANVSANVENSLRDIPYLNTAKTVQNFSSKPIQIITDPHLLDFLASITHYENGKDPKPITIESPIFEIVTNTDTALFATFYPNAADKGFVINLSYDVVNNLWSSPDPGYYELKLDPSNPAEPPLKFRIENAFKEKLAPFIYLENGALIKGRTLLEPKSEYKEISFPLECFVKGLVWNNCDINKEFLNDGEVEGAKKTVQGWLEKWLTDNLSAQSIIFKDHETGEIADFIAIQPNGNKGVISFYHCKSSPTKEPGASIRHISDVMEQVLRSISLINTRTLIGKILEHSNGGRPKSKFIRGNRELVDQMKDTFSPLGWLFQVVIVQPGLNCKDAAVYENTKILLLTCFEWLKAIGAELRIMGFYEEEKPP